MKTKYWIQIEIETDAPVSVASAGEVIGKAMQDSGFEFVAVAAITTDPDFKADEPVNVCHCDDCETKRELRAAMEVPK